MTFIRAAALAVIVAWAGAAHADCHRRYHAEAGLLVGIGILADFVGASVLADLIAPSEPDPWCADGGRSHGTAPCADASSVDIGMRYCSDQACTCPARWY